MQIQPVIMRLLVILSVATVIVGLVHAGTVDTAATVAYSGGGVVEVANNGGGGGAVLVLRRPTTGAGVSATNATSVVLPRPRSIQSGGPGGGEGAGHSVRSGMLTGTDSSEKNVYRTKVSKLKIILLADMIHDIPPQLELITCLANSSSLNITTKHCACERYSCKDLLSSSSSGSSSSSSSPFNSVNQRKIHTSCGEYCCRKKKFNRSIDPSIQNAVVAAVRHNSFAPPSPMASRVHQKVTDPLGPAHPTLASSSSSSSSSSNIPKQKSRWRSCQGGTVVDQIAISSGQDSGQRSGTHSQRQQNQNLLQSGPGSGHFQLPWLYRVILIEKELTICAGTLIHPSVLLTTAVCVINKNPDELIVRRQPTETEVGLPAAAAPNTETEADLTRAVQRILIPDQFATTFERLENNVALLVLQPIKVKQHLSESFPGSIDEGGSIFKQVFGRRTPGIITKSGLVDVGQLSYPFEETFSVQEEGKQKIREPSYICLSSIINHTSPPVEGSVCQIFSWRKPVRKNVVSSSTGRPRGHRPGRQRPRRRQRRQQHQNQIQASTTRPGDDGTNYITANISIFPATSLGSDNPGQDQQQQQQLECRREHRDYLQHQGNLCAGPADKSRTLDVDLSGSPLLCTETSPDDGGGVTRVVLRGILTWSTDINRAPHLFTNITTYRGWIESELDKLGLQLELMKSSVEGRRRRRQQQQQQESGPAS